MRRNVLGSCDSSLMPGTLGKSGGSCLVKRCRLCRMTRGISDAERRAFLFHGACGRFEASHTFEYASVLAPSEFSLRISAGRTPDWIIEKRTAHHHARRVSCLSSAKALTACCYVCMCCFCRRKIKAVANDDREGIALASLAKLYSAAGRRDSAAKCYETMLDNRPADGDVRISFV